MSDPHQDKHWMQQCIDLANSAEQSGEIPVGALLVQNDRLLAKSANSTIGDCDPSAHAEINVLRIAGRKVGNHRLTGTTLYVTLEPCIMCAGALVQARVKRVVFGAYDHQYGAAGSASNVLQTPLLNHQCEVTAGVMIDECRNLLDRFFRERRC